MALSENELAVLLSLFQDEQLEKRTFEYLGQALQHNFAKQDHFCVSCDLALLIQQSYLIINSHECFKLSFTYLILLKKLVERSQSLHMSFPS
ncbi:hypothetical protein MRX96_019157 [Rhipicephalus microplus]